MLPAPGPVAPLFPLPFITVPLAPLMVPPAPGTLIVVQAPVPPPMTLVVQAPVPAPVAVPVPAIVPAPAAAAPAPYAAPVRPRRAFRN